MGAGCCRSVMRHKSRSIMAEAPQPCLACAQQSLRACKRRLQRRPVQAGSALLRLAPIKQFGFEGFNLGQLMKRPIAQRFTFFIKHCQNSFAGKRGRLSHSKRGFLARNIPLRPSQTCFVCLALRPSPAPDKIENVLHRHRR